MTKRLIVLFIVCFSISIGLGAQEWQRNIKKKNPTFYDIRDAFYRHADGKDITKVPGWKQFKRWEWFMENRVDASGRLDSRLFWQALAEKKKKARTSVNAITSSWTELGPVGIPSGGGGMGRVNCVTYDPSDATIMWACAPSGGLWKSTDSGATWSTSTDDLPNIGISWIVINPDNRNIMYIATGDGDGGDTYSLGVMKSTDGGSSWNTTGYQTDITSYRKLRKLVMHPSDTDTLLSADSYGIYKTTDGGDTWARKQTGNFKDIEVNLSTPTIWYAAAREDGIYKSINSGETWSELTSGLPTFGFVRIELAVAASTPSTVYALYSNDDGALYGLYRSVDSGATWTLQASTPNLLGWSVIGADSTGQGAYDLTIEVNPINADEVYLGGVNLWKSTNGGTAWSCIGHWYGASGTPYVHADHHYLAFKPGSSTTLVSGNDGGVFVSADSGSSWTDISAGLAIHQIYRIGCSAQQAGKIMIGNQDNGSDLLSSGSWLNVLGGDGMECAIDPEDSNIMYGEYYYGQIYRSMNGGASWTSIGANLDQGAWVTPFQIDPNDANTLYLGASYVYKSTNRGSTWTALSGHLSVNNLRSLAVAPSDSNTIYTADRSTIFKTVNGGTDWTTLSGGGVPEGNITYIAVHPENPDIAWITRSAYYSGQKVYRSTNGGTSWTNVSSGLPNIPVNCVVVDGTSQASLKPVYVGTELGVYYSEDGTGSWQAFNTGLPNVIVNELEIHESSAKLRAATYGRGVWESPLATGTGIVVTSPNGGENWTAGSTHSVSWTSSGVTGNVTIALYKGGSLDSSIATTPVSGGVYSWTIPAGTTLGTDYKVRIYNGSVGDYSNGNFSIGDGSSSEITLNRSAVTFAAVKGNATAVTAAQDLYVTNSGSGAMSWTAVGDQSWISCTPASGSNWGIIAVSVDASGLSAGTYSGNVTVGATAASNSPRTMAVTLTVYGSGSTSAPFGEFATPVDGSTVSSSVPITGWVLDDIDVKSVKIYSNNSYVGNAVFVEGARTDIRDAYGTYPKNYQAGWGYMLLSNFLPGGGNGAYALQVIATDAEGNTTVLGTKNITVDNAGAVKPFGAIDSPGQGGTASGDNFLNQGWVLTPMPNKVAEDGTTIDVYVDGVYLGHPQYNVGREDIAGYFPGYANSSGPAALFYMDTTDYDNGIHSIYWIAEDNAGNADGIGSRFFTVRNTGSSRQAKGTAAKGARYREIGDLSVVPPESIEPVTIARGYGNKRTMKKQYPDADGRIVVDLKELERLEILPAAEEDPWLNGACSVYRLVGGQLRPLPPGAGFDTEKGMFYWQPAPGFFGEYRFCIIKPGAELRKKIIHLRIIPKFAKPVK
ncbi:MAG: hypothetical protein GY765_21800 [bacterium]|nr:hypothetical protein [bacterium]